MAAETIAYFLLGGDRDDWIFPRAGQYVLTPHLQWRWLRTTVWVERSKRHG